MKNKLFLICICSFIGLFAISCSESGNVEKYYNEAKKFYDNDEYEPSINLLNKAIKADPYCEKCYKSRGYSYLFLGEYDLAQKDLMKALTLKGGKKDLTVYHGIGLILLRYKKEEEAMGYFMQAHAIDSSDTTINNAISQTYYRTEDFKNAAKYISYSLQRDPTNHDYLIQRVRIYLLQEDSFKLFSELNKIQELFPAEIKLCFNFKGKYFIFKGNVSEALYNLNQSIKTDSNYVSSYYMRSLVYKAINKKELACNDVQKVKMLDPNTDLDKKVICP
jgi:tetratricopeptide (TPR) repeat protein